MKRHIKGNYKTNNYLFDEIVYHNNIQYIEPSLKDSININNDENIFTYKTDNYMFYKENIINILLDKIITSQYTKICIMDADIMFQNKIWYDIISSSLNNLTICQQFNETIWFFIF